LKKNSGELKPMYHSMVLLPFVAISLKTFML